MVHGVSVRVTLRNDHEVRKRSTDKDVAAYCGVDRWRLLAEHEITIVGYAFRNRRIHVAEASRLTGRTWNTSKKDLDRLVKKGLLTFIAPKKLRDPDAHYEIFHPKRPKKDADQSARFIEAARAAGASEDEAVFDAVLKKILKAESNTQDSESVPNSPRKKQ